MESLAHAFRMLFIFAWIGIIAIVGAAGYGLFKFVTWLF